ncbi:MAG: hypothetical protein KKI08_27075 [Armatimonadetes bacterium]|nr:hypothetical protein [Armatimonadota bacterium]
MATAVTQDKLLHTAQAYLKSTYGEDTVRMDVLSDNVVDGNGALTVECTVSVGGSHSNWRKTFTFRDGRVVNMTWRHLG